MESVAIGSNPYDSYATVEQADAYLAAALQAGTDWSSASETTKAQALATATRVLDRQRWADGYTTQAERAAVQQIADACIEMALSLVQGSSLQSEQTTAQKLQSIRAGSVSLTYFRGAEGAPLRFPLIVFELLRDYIAGATFAVGMQSSGTDGISVTGDTLGHTEGM